MCAWEHTSQVRTSNTHTHTHTHTHTTHTHNTHTHTQHRYTHVVPYPFMAQQHSPNCTSHVCKPCMCVYVCVCVCVLHRACGSVSAGRRVCVRPSHSLHRGTERTRTGTHTHTHRQMLRAAMPATARERCSCPVAKQLKGRQSVIIRGEKRVCVCVCVCVYTGSDSGE